MSRGPLFPSRGWSLLELLIAMTLSLLVIAGIGHIYLAAKRSYDIQTNLAQIQDVGRYVTDTLIQDIRTAGYWDLMNINLADSTPNDDPDFSPTPASPDRYFLTGDVIPGGCPGTNATDWGKMITQRIFGINDTDPSTIPAPNTYNCISSWLRGDVLVVRYADPAIVTGSFTGTRSYIRTSPFQGILTSGDPNTTAANFATTYSAFDPLLIDTVTSAHAVVAHAYYVASPISTACGNVPVLAREYLLSNGTPSKAPLVNGVELLEFQYGVDTAVSALNPAGDGSVNEYVDADQITCTGGTPCWNQIRAVRFWALVRANCQESGYTDTTAYQLGDTTYTPGDHYRRALYSSTVALRNLGGL